MTETMPVLAGCDECNGYLRRRATAIAPAIFRTAARHKVRPRPLAIAFFAGVHARHESGRRI